MRISMRLFFWLGVLLLSCAPSRAAELDFLKPVLVVQGGPRQTIRVAKVSPHGDLLATLDGSLLQLWTRDGGVLWSRGVTGDSHSLAWSRDGKKLAVGIGGLAGMSVFKPGDSAGALELDARDGRILRTLLHGNNVAYDLAYLPGNRLSARLDGRTMVWNEAGKISALGNGWGPVSLLPTPTPQPLSRPALNCGTRT